MCLAVPGKVVDIEERDGTRMATVDFGGVVHHDFETGAVTMWDPGAGRSAGEWLFVADGDGEGEGWLMTYVYDAGTDRSDLVVLDDGLGVADTWVAGRRAYPPS